MKLSVDPFCFVSCLPDAVHECLSSVFQFEEAAQLFWPFPPLYRTFPADGSDGERDVAAPLIHAPLSPPRWPFRLQALQRSGYCRSFLHLYHRSVSHFVIVRFAAIKRIKCVFNGASVWLCAASSQWVILELFRVWSGHLEAVWVCFLLGAGQTGSGF